MEDILESTTEKKTEQQQYGSSSVDKKTKLPAFSGLRTILACRDLAVCSSKSLSSLFGSLFGAFFSSALILTSQLGYIRFSKGMEALG